MKTGFKDPIKSSIKEKNQVSPWNFDCPPYDERSSCYVNAGAHHGVGHRQPVGHSAMPKQRVGTMPMGKVKTLKDDEVGRKNINLDIDV
jgi:hypothetical protein